MEPVAHRLENESKVLDTSHPLAQTIIRGCKTGYKKGSPVDCFVLSPELELMGRQPVNEYLRENRIQGVLSPVGYLMFLKQSLHEKFPGLGHIVLNNEEPSQDILNIYYTPVERIEDPTIVMIDTRAFENGGRLSVNINVGMGDGEGWFDLYDDDRKLSRKEQADEDPLVSTWIEPGDTGQITYCFDRGKIFKLSAIGSWYNKKGSINAFQAIISVG